MAIDDSTKGKQHDEQSPAKGPAATPCLGNTLQQAPNSFYEITQCIAGNEENLNVRRQAASVPHQASDGKQAASPPSEGVTSTVTTDGEAAPRGCGNASLPAVTGRLTDPNGGGTSGQKRRRCSSTGYADADGDVGEVDDIMLDDGGLPEAGQVDGLPRDVVLRIEFTTSMELKVLYLVMVSSLLAGVAITTYFKVSAQAAGKSWYMLHTDKPNFRDNFVAGVICCGLLSILWLLYVVRGIWFLIRRRRWDHRRVRIYLSRLAELTVAIVNLAAWTYAGSERRLETDCHRFHRTLLWTYGVRLTAANTLLCIWTISARGITVHRGGPLTLRKRLPILLRQKLVRCCGAERQASLGAIRQDSPPSSGRATTAAAGPGSAVSPSPARGGFGAQARSRGSEAATDPAERLVVRELKLEGQGASEVLATSVLLPVTDDGGVGKANPAAPGALTRPAAAAGPTAQPSLALQAAASLDPRDPRNPDAAEGHSPAGNPAPAGLATGNAAVAAVAAGRADQGAPPSGGGPPGQGTEGLGGAGIGIEARAVLPVPETEPLAITAASAATTTTTTTSPAPDVQSAPPAPALPTVSPGSATQVDFAATDGKALPVEEADSAVGAAALVAAAAAAVVTEAEHVPEAQAHEDVSRAADIAADLMATDAGRDEQIYIDAPWWEFLAPVGWLWLPFQCLVSLTVAYLAAQGYDTRQNTTGTSCMDIYLTCTNYDTPALITLAVMLGGQAVYALIYISFCLKAFAYLRSRSYVLYRQLNIFLSVEVRIRGTAVIFLVVNEFVQALVVPAAIDSDGGNSECRFSLDAMLGLWSTQVVTMMVVLVLAWVYIPRSVLGDVPIMQATLQRFAWTEADLPRQRALRLSTVRTNPHRIEQLDREPMFCFETAVKLTYWCEHAYYYEEPDCTMRLSIEKLKEMFELEHVIVKRNEDSDAKVVIGWTWKHCLLCFRGTASLKAACVDLKAMLVPYYQRTFWKQKHKMAALASVHHGFQWSWTHGGFNKEVMDWVRSYRVRHPHGKIIVTGHSLGGAHAVLCTLDLVRELGISLPHQHITCYTYGAPRVGDHAFAGLYNRAVAETWHLINGNDMVPLSPKYLGWFVYKQPGHKVIVKRRGDIVVRPSFIENSVVRVPCSRSLRQHLLGSYLRSLMAVLRMQTRGKHIEGGVRGLLSLSRLDLPEVTEVLVELVKEVRAVAIAAAEAVEDESRRAGHRDNVSPAQAAAVAMVAASRTGRRGHTVLHFMAKHRSLRLLLTQPTPVTPAADAASAPPQEVEVEVDPLPSSPSEPRSGKNIFRGIMNRIDLGMQLLGVETGMAGEDDVGASRGGGRRSGNSISQQARAAREAELCAFQRAAAGHSAAQVRYRHLKSLRARERRAAAGGVAGRMGSWVASLATAAGLHSTANAGAVARDGVPARGPGSSSLRLTMRGRRTQSDTSARLPRNADGAGVGAAGGGGGGRGDDGSNSGSGSGSGRQRRKLRAARRNPRQKSDAIPEGSRTAPEVASRRSLRSVASLPSAGRNATILAATSPSGSTPAAQPIGSIGAAARAAPSGRATATVELAEAVGRPAAAANGGSGRTSGPVAEGMEAPALGGLHYSHRGRDAAGAAESAGRVVASTGEVTAGGTGTCWMGSNGGGYRQGSGSSAGSGSDWEGTGDRDERADAAWQHLLVHAGAGLAAVAVARGSVRAVHRAVELERLRLVREDAITALDKAWAGLQGGGPSSGTRGAGAEQGNGREGSVRRGTPSRGPSEGHGDVETGSPGRDALRPRAGT